jgi:crotonobetainyl-CoA:carnitine CoA-transferase CaiB-like acyl-CoA transferase
MVCDVGHIAGCQGVTGDARLDPMNTPTAQRPLEGIRVLEVGQFLAGPFAACLLGYFGAEVIKIEAPEGDPIRTWRVTRDGTSLWWYSLARNKKSVVIDLSTSRGRELVRDLALRSDVLIENFKPGVMERWQLGPAQLNAQHPELIYTRVSGYGQTGPYASKPGFASVCEAFGGFRYLNGFEDRPPVRPNLSMGDTLAGFHAAFGVLLAMIARSRKRAAAGQVVDVAIYESVFNLLEGVIPEYDGAGVVRGPSGSTITGIVPTNTYLCRDAKHVVIGANSDSLFQRLMRAIGRADMATDPRFTGNANRVQHEREIDAAIAAWAAEHSVQEAVATLETAGVPAGPIYSVADMAVDPQYQARGLFHEVETPAGPLKIPAITPHLSATPGATQWPGPRLGAHTDEVLETLLGLDATARAGLREERIIA